MKRSRAPNFTASEVTHLMSLIEKYPIIESKKIDGATVKEKHEAWQKLTVEYNSQTNYLARTPENLLACYKNQKIKLKKAHSSDKMTIRVEDHGLDGRHVPEAINQNIPDQLGFNQLDKEVKKEVDSTEGSPPASPSYSDSVLERDKTLTGPSSEEDGEFKDQQHMHILPIEFPWKLELLLRGYTHPHVLLRRAGLVVVRDVYRVAAHLSGAGRAAWLVAAYLAGRIAGQDAGHAAGRTAGHAAGRTTGHVAGRVAGHAAGRAAGHAAGRAAGLAVGQGVGRAAGHAAERAADHAATRAAGRAAGRVAGRAADCLAKRVVSRAAAWHRRL
ncbi:hypothetical protein MSG28_011423 [Choristoneura fumiferana]|uniref:Uncharacterized protein n=1 Tax=Choristoneura fumiferana TaxID=7141 RepID=A0ACC0JN52_CHOFU|nr:hypothetical protein MSG28_011423 [Choristoneura fumiferana]